MKLFQFWGIFFSSLLSIVTGSICYIWAGQFIKLTNERFEIAVSPSEAMLTTIAFVVIGILLGFLATSFIYNQMIKFRYKLQKISPADKVAWIVGFVIGIFPASFVAYLAYTVTKTLQQPILQYSLSLLAFAIVMWLVVFIASSMKEEIKYMFSAGRGSDIPAGGASSGGVKVNYHKIIDTNVIIDGRIYDILATGFIEGKILVPNFILEELQYIADSADPLKRSRGRRGLDILYKIQKEYDDKIEILDKVKVVFAHNEAVDMKLVKIANSLPSACLLTNDFNLNKIAKLNGVDVLNINELANALKPVILPGEEIEVLLIKEGKEADQGLGYLDDGTMVVVDHAYADIGKKVSVTVSSVLQTVAGKMIFADRHPSEELLQRLQQQ